MDNVQTIRIQILAIIGSVLLIFFIIELIRRKRLREEFSILWLAMGVVFLVLSIFRGLLDQVFLSDRHRLSARGLVPHPDHGPDGHPDSFLRGHLRAQGHAEKARPGDRAA